MNPSFGLLLTLLAQAGQPEPSALETLELTWQAPAPCPDRARVEQLIMELAGQKARGSLAVSATVSRTRKGRYQARLLTLMHGFRGERTLVGDSCEEVSRASALVIALMLNPPAAETEVTPEEGDSVRLGPTEPTSPATTESRALKPAEGGRLGVRGVTAVGLGVLPGLTAGAELHGLWVRDLFSVELRLGAWIPKTAWSPERAGAGGTFWLVELSPFLCVKPRLAGIRLDSCIGMPVGRLQGSGFGVSNPGSNSALYPSFAVEQAAAISASRALSFRLSLGFHYPVSRPRFALENVGELYRPPTLGFRTTLGAEIRL